MCICKKNGLIVLIKDSIYVSTNCSDLGRYIINIIPCIATASKVFKLLLFCMYILCSIESIDVSNLISSEHKI